MRSDNTDRRFPVPWQSLALFYCLYFPKNSLSISSFHPRCHCKQIRLSMIILFKGFAAMAVPVSVSSQNGRKEFLWVFQSKQDNLMIFPGNSCILKAARLKKRGNVKSSAGLKPYLPNGLFLPEDWNFSPIYRFTWLFRFEPVINSRNDEQSVLFYLFTANVEWKNTDMTVIHVTFTDH